MKTKHTKGTWFYSRNEMFGDALIVCEYDDNKTVIIGSTRNPYLTAKEYEHEMSKHRVSEIVSEKNANAKLMAAAPDLLDALKMAMNRIGDLEKRYMPETSVAWGVCERAIKKAIE